MLRGFWLGVALLAAGCGDGEKVGDPNPTDMSEAGAPSLINPVCEAGRQVECPCPNGGLGAQACADDGSKWQACQCGDAKPPVPEAPPSEACGARLMIKPAPEQACPTSMPAMYVRNACPPDYYLSGLCAPNPDNVISCCPDD